MKGKVALRRTQRKELHASSLQNQLTLVHQQAVLLRSFVQNTAAWVPKAPDPSFNRSPVGLQRVILCRVHRRGTCYGFHRDIDLELFIVRYVSSLKRSEGREPLFLGLPWPSRIPDPEAVGVIR